MEMSTGVCVGGGGGGGGDRQTDRCVHVNPLTCVVLCLKYNFTCHTSLSCSTYFTGVYIRQSTCLILYHNGGFMLITLKAMFGSVFL